MHRQRFLDISVYVFAALLLGGAIFLVHRHDQQVMSVSFGWGQRYDSLSQYRAVPSDEERRIAGQFTDTTLPQLRRLGLIKRYYRTEIETVVTVSGRIWNERSEFFKESLLTQLIVYNRVNGFPSRIRIVDERSERLYAQVIPPDRKEFF